MGYSVINKKKYFKNLIAVFFIAFLALSFYNINLSFAYDLSDAFGEPLEKAAQEGAGYIDTSWEDIVSQIIQLALTLLGVIFLILMIYGGYLWMTARGNEEQTTKAKNAIVAAIIGIVIVLSAYAISYFVVKKLGEKALESSTSAGNIVSKL